MNKYKLTIASFLIFLFACSGTVKECPQGINLLPMYGHKTKCKEQLESDSIFLAESDRVFKSRKEAAERYIEKAWEFYYQDKMDMAMKRFNQAWLLDSMQADIYWGFGNILGTKKQFEASIPLFEKSISLNAQNPLVLEGLATSYANMFWETQDTTFLNKSIKSSKQAILLNPAQARPYVTAAVAYVYLNQRDSAIEYMAKADKLDSTAINPEQRAAINTMPQ